MKSKKSIRLYIYVCIRRVLYITRVLSIISIISISLSSLLGNSVLEFLGAPFPKKFRKEEGGGVEEMCAGGGGVCVV
jgi:hypothetical protein